MAEPTQPSGAVFLSYASQDAEAAKRICAALRAAGVEVWFDQNELTGGDAWDAKIRGQVASCALFLPVISAATQARLEGYFRIEWKLAAQRTHAMADEKAFLLPVVIDDTRDAEARVPAEFKAVQWTRLPGGETPEKFCARVKALLGGASTPARADVGARLDRAQIAADPEGRGQAAPLRKPRPWFLPAGLALGLAVAALALWRPWEKSPPAASVARLSPKQAEPVLLSPARQLADRANALSLKKYNSTADDFAAAEGLFKQALALDQNDAEIWAIASQFNTAIRTRGFDDAPARRETARSQAERALKLDSNSTEGLFALGRWQRDNDPDRTVAEKTFQAVLARAPEHEGAIGNLGTMYGRQDRVEEALALFERAARNPATAPLARYSQYLTYFGHWRFEEAERAVRASIAAEPSSNSVTGLAMLLLTAKGDAASAVWALADLPAANRNEHRAVWMSAFAHLAAREPDAALTALRRLTADFVQDNWFVGPTAYWVGRAHAQASRGEAARIAFEAGLAVMDAKLKAASDDYTLHVARGELLAWLGRTEEALREARTATELAGGRDELFWFISPVRIYAALGRADEAMPLLEKLSAREGKAVQWPLTPALLRIDPLWDKLRGDVRFQALCIEPATVERKTVAVPSAPPIDQKSVAVLAFANLSDDKGNEYFSDGISEELLNVLAKIPGLKVTARTSAFYFKGKEVPIPEIAQKLGVAYVVEGSVRKVGTQVRIAAQLIKAADGFQVWTDSFTRELKDIFAVQDEIAGLIAKNLELKMGMASSVTRREVKPEAYRLLLQARFFAQRENRDGRLRSLEYYRRAIVEDPGYAQAWGELARVYAMLARYGDLPMQEGIGEARTAAERALELNPAEPSGSNALGWVQRLADWDWHGARKSFARALALAPDDPTFLSDDAVILWNTGQEDEAITLARRAIERDPLSARAHCTLGELLSMANRDAESVQIFSRAIELSPELEAYHALRATNLCRLQRYAEAEASLAGEPNEGFRLMAESVNARQRGDLVASVKARGELIARHGARMVGWIGLVYAHQGENDQAFAWLERAAREHDRMIPWMRNHNYLRGLHADPRWPVFLKKIGLSDEQLK